MPNPQFIEEAPLTLVEVKETLEKIEKSNPELNYRANKTKEYLNTFVEISKEKKEELAKKLLALKLVRLKEAQIAKIIDLLPKTTEELKVILQAYPLTLPKTDQESIVSLVKETAK